jgi:hypothetical protein
VSDESLIRGIAASIRAEPQDVCHHLRADGNALCGYAVPASREAHRDAMDLDFHCTGCQRLRCIECVGIVVGWRGPAR